MSFIIIGVGIQFSEQDSKHVRNKIEIHLTGTVKSEKYTYTL